MFDLKVFCNCREALLAKTFYSWWSKYQLMMDVRMMERMVRITFMYFDLHYVFFFNKNDTDEYLFFSLITKLKIVLERINAQTTC